MNTTIKLWSRNAYYCIRRMEKPLNKVEYQEMNYLSKETAEISFAAKIKTNFTVSMISMIITDSGSYTLDAVYFPKFS